MSIQSEINRIKGNVEDTLDVITSTGVTVPEGSNSDDLPGLVRGLANEKQDKDTALTTSGGTLNDGSSLKSQADDSGNKASIIFSTNAVDIKTDSGDMAGIRVSGQTFLGETTNTVNIRGKKVTIGGEFYTLASNNVIEVTEETPANVESGTAPVYSTKIKNLVDPTDPKDAVPKRYLDDNFMTSPTGGMTGQVLTKTESGAEWQDDPESGISQDDADARYLKLSGGTLTGELVVSSSGIKLNDGQEEEYVPRIHADKGIINLYTPNGKHTELTVKETPNSDTDPASKKYVDQKLTPIETKIEKYEPTQIIIASASEMPAVVDNAILITYEE